VAVPADAAAASAFDRGCDPDQVRAEGGVYLHACEVRKQNRTTL
jgi:hypothetical protein